jgi:hypothetical protein
LHFSGTENPLHIESLQVAEEKSFSSLFSIRKITMKKIQASQARAVVGGGFFKSLFKASTGGLIGLADPVTVGTVVAIAGGAASTTKARQNMR